MIALLPLLIVANDVYFQWRDGLIESHAKLSDVQAIVKVDKINPETARGAFLGHVPTPRKMPLIIIEATCLDGRGVQKDQKLRIAIRLLHGLDARGCDPTPKVGSNYLLIGMKPFQHKLVYTFSNAQVQDHLYVDTTEELEIAAQMMLLTQMDKLSKGDTALQVIRKSAISCLEKADDLTACRVFSLLQNVQPNKTPRDSKMVGGEKIDVCESCDETQRLEKYAQSATAIQKSLIYGLLLRWHVSGALQKYRDSLIALSSNPSAYYDEYSAPLLIDDIHKYRGIDGHFCLKDDDWLTFLLNAKNDRLCLLFLKRFGDSPIGLSEIQMRRYVLLLNHRSEEVRFIIAGVLSGIFNEPDQRPTSQGKMVNGRYIEHPDLEEKVAYWRNRFGVKPPN